MAFTILAREGRFLAEVETDGPDLRTLLVKEVNGGLWRPVAALREDLGRLLDADPGSVLVRPLSPQTARVAFAPLTPDPDEDPFEGL